MTFQFILVNSPSWHMFIPPLDMDTFPNWLILPFIAFLISIHSPIHLPIDTSPFSHVSPFDIDSFPFLALPIYKLLFLTFKHMFVELKTFPSFNPKKLYFFIDSIWFYGIHHLQMMHVNNHKCKISMFVIVIALANFSKGTTVLVQDTSLPPTKVESTFFSLRC